MSDTKEKRDPIVYIREEIPSFTAPSWPGASA